MPRKGWKNVGIPEELWEEVNKIINENPMYGKSVNEFVRRSVLLELEKRKKNEKDSSE